MSNAIGNTPIANISQGNSPIGKFKKSEHSMPEDSFKKESLGDKEKHGFLGLRMIEKFRDSRIGKALIKTDSKAAIAGGKIGTYAGGFAGLAGAMMIGGIIGGATGLGLIPAAAIFIEEVFVSGIGLSIGGAAGAVAGSNIGNIAGKLTGLGNEPSNIK